MSSRRALSRLVLAAALLAAPLGAQDRHRAPAPPPPPAPEAVPWWLWPSMLVPPLFLMVAGYVATRRFDQHRALEGPGAGSAPPPPP